MQVDMIDASYTKDAAKDHPHNFMFTTTLLLMSTTMHY